MSYAVGHAAKRFGERRPDGVFGAFGDEPAPSAPPAIPDWLRDWAQQNVPGWGAQPAPGTPGAPPPPGSEPVPAPSPSGPPQGSQVLGPDPDMTTLLAVGIAAVGLVAFVWVMRQ